MPRRPDPVADELLVLACQQGSRAAFDALFARWNGRLVAHAARTLGRAADGAAAQDVAQEAWLGIVRGLDRPADPRRFRAWMFAVVTQRAQDWLRRAGRIERAEHAAGERTESVNREAAAGDHEADAIDAMRTALATLSADDRALLGLFYREELSVAEIAEALVVPPGTVKSRLFHARKRLRAAIAHIDTGEPT